MKCDISIIQHNLTDKKVVYDTSNNLVRQVIVKEKNYNNISLLGDIN
ncbi:MAG: hypothetical protein K0Q49_653 [Haloplasmataceae bacterium]|jgi:hypothetical protein|nr:hypothetical protein [Haloplasmataceae bacterium]